MSPRFRPTMRITLVVTLLSLATVFVFYQIDRSRKIQEFHTSGRLHAAAQSNDIAILNDYLSLGGPTEVFLASETLINTAVKSNSFEFVDTLLSSGADPNFGQRGRINWQTPFHFAVENRNIEIAERLLDAGASFIYPMRTPLVLRTNMVEFVKLIEKYGYDLTDCQHLSYLIRHCVKDNNTIILEYLLTYYNDRRCITQYLDEHSSPTFHVSDEVALLFSNAGYEVPIRNENPIPESG